MKTTSFEIPRARWSATLHDLQRLAVGRLVTIEIVDVEVGDQELAARLPLRAIAVEAKGSERGDFVVAVGPDGGEIEHRVRAPTRLLLGFDDDAGETRWLVVEQSTGAKTFVHFQSLPLLDVGDARPTAPP